MRGASNLIADCGLPNCRLSRSERRRMETLPPILSQGANHWHCTISGGPAVAKLGVVAIGRNEGERLRRCLESVDDRAEAVVYVDSGSTDGSIELAHSLGVQTLALDLSIPDRKS